MTTPSIDRIKQKAAAKEQKRRAGLFPGLVKALVEIRQITNIIPVGELQQSRVYEVAYQALIKTGWRP